MINFIIYEKNVNYQKSLKNDILKIIGGKKEKFHIYIFNEYNSEFDSLILKTGKKIYLLNLEMNGLQVSKKIRENEDWNSQILLITKYNFDFDKNYKNHLILDLINLNDYQRIIDSLSLAIRILNRQKSFQFFYNNEFYQIPYNDILYFEKNLNDNYVSIITKDDIYRIKESIKKIEEKLNSVSLFFKTHQSCIVNLKNIIKIDFNNNIIYFKKEKIDLISRKKRKDLKEKIEQEDYEYF